MGTLTAAAQPSSVSADKSGYTLFNPTPRSLMRPLAADRPDATESPVTVDAGHIQIETSFIDFTLNDDAATTRSIALFDTNLKIGLTNNIDLQILFSPHTHERTGSPGSRSTVRSPSDIQLRTKINLWGNDQPGPSNTAFGVMPYVTIPTGVSLGTGKVEGGLIAMIGWDAAENYSLGFQIETAFIHDPADDSHDTEISHTAVLGFDLIGDLGAYIEYLGVISTDADGDYLPFFSTGVTYALTEDLVLDFGTRIGLVDNADDINLFTGITARF